MAIFGQFQGRQKKTRDHRQCSDQSRPWAHRSSWGRMFLRLLEILLLCGGPSPGVSFLIRVIRSADESVKLWIWAKARVHVGANVPNFALRAHCVSSILEEAGGEARQWKRQGQGQRQGQRAQLVLCCRRLHCHKRGPFSPTTQMSRKEDVTSGFVPCTAWSWTPPKTYVHEHVQSDFLPMTPSLTILPR